MRLVPLSAAMLLALPVGALAQDAAPSAQPKPPLRMPLMQSIANDVQPDALRATIAKLVSFGTRHTLSDTVSDKRGIGAARRWVKARFEEVGKQCDGCLQIQTPEQTVSGERIPQPTTIMDVLAIQRGSDDPDRVIVISGHLDSRVRDVMDAKSDAPGADDDGSGTAAVLEAARILSKHKFHATLVYAVLQGEEQGLYGGKLLAQYAHDQHWSVEAALNNDIIGNTLGTNGLIKAGEVRVFSEGTRSTETPDQATHRRFNGGEVDSPSRNLARYIDGLADTYLKDFKVRMVYRTDRYRRGGDQVPMLAMGYPAVRFTEAIENYNREHQDVRTENGVHYGDVLDAVDFDYLAQVARLNIVTMAALAMAPAPPAMVKTEGAVSMDTTVSWSAVPAAAGYRVWWRDTTAARWGSSRAVAGGATSVVLKDVNIDDWFFGVSAVSGEGYESPVEFPGEAGAFGAGGGK
jgi:hypothetical protein